MLKKRERDEELFKKNYYNKLVNCEQIMNRATDYDNKAWQTSEKIE